MWFAKGASTATGLIALGLIVAMTAPTLAAPGGNGRGNGNAYGYGYYRNNGGGGGVGGAPLPALGITLVGQTLALGGLVVAWRVRRRRRTDVGSNEN